MPELDELLRTWTDSATTVSPAEARRRAEGRDGAAAAGGPRRRTLLLAAAAVTVVAGIAGALAFRAADDDRVDTTPATTPTTDAPSPTVTEPVTPTTPTTAPDEPTTTVAPPRGGALPPRWVGRTVDGRLVAVDTAAGGEQTLATFDDPRVPSSEPVAAGSYLGMVELSPDGTTVYYETCCEPAVGQVYRVPVTGGDPELVTTGTHPAVSPDGTKLAVVELQAIKVRDLATGAETRYEAATPPTMVSHPAWSPDGRSIAVERYDADVRVGRVVVLDLADGGDLDAAREVVAADADGTPRFPTFDAAGRLHVVRQGVDQEGGPLGPARIEVHSPAVTAEISRRFLDQPLRSQHHDPTGGFVLRVLADGTVEITDSQGTPRSAGTGFDDAAW